MERDESPADVLHQLLERAAATFGDRPAVVEGDRYVDYEELEARSNQVAHLLIDLGVRRGDRVALYLDKSIESVVGLYGVLKAGAVYVPLDAQAPASRLGFVAANCGARWVITAANRADEWAALLDAGAPFEHALVLDAAPEPREAVPQLTIHPPSELDDRATTTPSVRSIDADLAYILYTSGSTGTPKGVMLSHRNALAFVTWAVRTFEVTSHDRLSSHAPLHFDLSVFDLFAASMAGAAVVIVPARASVFPRLAVRFIEDQRISIWYSVPSILAMMVLRGGLETGALPGLRVVLFAGEVFPTKYLRQLVGYLPHVRFANLFGPTETNVCTWHEVVELPSDDDDLPIGVAIDGDEAIVVGDDGSAVAPGTPGELYVRGATVMQGYWADPERTARSRVPNPWWPEVGDPVYRTGDLVRERPDGNLEFLGRRDAQVKSRGYRIELGDIETTVNAHHEVVECAVVAVPDELVGNRIRCHVVLGTDAAADPGLLASFCADRLPVYMIPESFELHGELPRTSNGKIDRRALQQLAPTPRTPEGN
jgi:amino acid adenylation domain-containing protein